MRQRKPGCYVRLGAGAGPDTENIHHPRYDFNDAMLAIGFGVGGVIIRRE